jgi:amino acid adenylation domain-containing protein
MEYTVDSSSIQGLFAEQARRTPDAVAVSSARERLTYRELDERANRLAHRLQGLGAGPEVPVAVLMDRSPDVVVAILAVVKSGGCYLPVHSAYPIDRMQWIVEQSGAPILLADEVMRDRGLPTAGQVIVVDGDRDLAGFPATDPGAPAEPDQLAYVIYTSGSTGHPKGVAVTQWDVLGLALDHFWDGGAHEIVLMIAPHAFNVSTYELWVPLLHGGRIVVAPPGQLDLATLRRMIASERISGLHLTAGLFRVIAEEAPECLAGVKEVLTGGDVISPLAVQRFLQACPGLIVRAMYGATEATLFSTGSPMTAPYTPQVSVPVGRPMDDVTVHVLDERLGQIPVGIIGEVYIGGRGVSRGYFGRPDLTAERFVADPFGDEGAWMYRTGDLGRWGADGQLEFMGRATDQVKILGFRVELAEVEAVLAKYPGVADVAVVAQGTDGDNRLTAYIVRRGHDWDMSELRGHAAQYLPEYMVPATFGVLDALPLTPNGKLDRRALPEPGFSSSSLYRAPRTNEELVLCKLFREVLGVERVGIDDSFFHLGGQSLLAMRLISRIRSVLRVDLPIKALFDAPTVAGLAERIDLTIGRASVTAAGEPGR